ncbi:MAG: hypothetical protein A2Y62_14835 [Candidatus Fischerbacteria bacterium RBG_13_37_8]|uniref:HTH luxR-type domain-containing protein n=1 Tax=Candidatus Fischerbacteria bacterium RBG_13_37_8 TaxID=1817863 RepID=A0A1F5VMV8_9BACT|nr:MAG: hypothetical protein A2Y62_14835 [Candidatus Fischerbacteria bacterium RBG_13_37_8]
MLYKQALIGYDIDMNESYTEAQAIREIKEGNNDAFGMLVRKYQKQVYYFAFGIICNHHLAEEISQETFVRLWKSLRAGKFDESRAIYPWIRAVCLNLTRDFLRNRKKQLRIMNEMAHKDMTETHELNNPCTDLEKVARAIESMDHDKREVLTLRIIEGLSYKEISEHLQCSIGTVMSRLFRARLELKTKIEKGV